VSERRIRVHIENYRAGESDLRLEPEKLEAAFSASSVPRGRIELSFNDDPARTEEAASDAEVLFAIRRPKTLASAGSLIPDPLMADSRGGGSAGRSGVIPVAILFGVRHGRTCCPSPGL